MSVSEVNNISPLDKPFKKVEDKSTSKKIEKAPPKKAPEGGAETKKISSPINDKVEISNVAKSLYKARVEQNTYRGQDTQILNKKTAEEIKNRINNDFYTQEKVIDKIVDSILSLPSFSKLHRTESEKLSEKERLEKLNSIRDKIKNSEYDSDEVIDTIVEKILGQLSEE